MKENKIPYPSQKIFSIDDARELAKWRLPRLVFDFVDGASGNEFLSINNNKAYENIKLEPRVLINVEKLVSSSGDSKSRNKKTIKKTIFRVTGYTNIIFEIEKEQGTFYIETFGGEKLNTLLKIIRMFLEL